VAFAGGWTGRARAARPRGVILDHIAARGPRQQIPGKSAPDFKGMRCPRCLPRPIIASGVVVAVRRPGHPSGNGWTLHCPPMQLLRARSAFFAPMAPKTVSVASLDYVLDPRQSAVRQGLRSFLRRLRRSVVLFNRCDSKGNE